MKVLQLHIQRFRGIREGRVVFDPHTCLIGPNSCGKSTVIDAMALVFGRDRILRGLTEHDFSGSDPSAADRLRIVATVAGFAQNTTEANLAWFRDGRAVPKWWDPATQTLSEEKTRDSEVLAAQIGFAARFDRETLEVHTVRYFHDHDGVVDPFDADAVTQVPGKLISDIGFFLVPAVRTWERMASFSSEVFRRLIASAGGLPSEELLDERNRLRTPTPRLEATTRLSVLSGRINAEVARLLPTSPQFQLRITSTDSDSLLQALTPHYEAPGSPSLPASRHGTGLLSLQSLVLLLELGKSRKEAGQSFILAIEEPELHMPPALHTRILLRAQTIADQTITTSHSPRAAASFSPTSIHLVSNSDGTLSAPRLAVEAPTQTTPNSIRKLFGDNRQDTIDALMHQRVLVPEGRIDFEWLRLLSQHVEELAGPTALPADAIPFGSMVGVIPTHDAAVVATFQELDKIRSAVCCLVDGDDPGDGYVQALLACTHPPVAIVQWANDQIIEDVVSWIIQADPAPVLTHMAAWTGIAIADMTAFRTLLATETRQGGLKGNYLAYSEVAGLIRDNPLLRERTIHVLQSLSKACLNATAPIPRMTRDARSTGTSTVLRWAP